MIHSHDTLFGKIILSTSLHVVGALALVFGVPGFSSPTPPPALPWKPIPIDIVEIGAITNTRLRGETKKSAKTSPHKATPAPEKKPKPPKPAKTKIEEVPLDDDIIYLNEKNKPKEEKPPEKTAKEPPVDPLASVLKNLAHKKIKGREIEDSRDDEKTNKGESKDGEGKGFGPALSDRLTLSQEDALRRQIGSCWNMPIGARNAENLIVEVLIEVKENRTVQSAQIVDQRRLSSDSHFRAAAEAALRALRHPRCTPLALPEGYYEQWKTIRFNFDPRDML